MKPNVGKAIVVFGKWQWNGLPVDLAVPVGKRIPPRTLKWLIGFSEKNHRPLIYAEQIVENGVYQKEQEFFAYGPPAFQQDMERMRQEGKKLW